MRCSKRWRNQGSCSSKARDCSPLAVSSELQARMDWYVLAHQYKPIHTGRTTDTAVAPDHFRAVLTASDSLTGGVPFLKVNIERMMVLRRKLLRLLVT